MELVRLYEERCRVAVLIDVSAGLDPRARQFLTDRGRDIETSSVVSADYLSAAAREVGGDRLIEVKGRGGRGPISVNERQLETFEAAGDLAWLYVVFGVTQPQEAELRLVPSPSRLAWRETRAATRPRGQARGVQHEALFEVSSDEIVTAGAQIDLTDLGDAATLPAWAGPRRD